MGSLAFISKENAGKGTADQADNKIDDPNDVNETTDGLQMKKQAANTLTKIKGKTIKFN